MTELWRAVLGFAYYLKYRLDWIGMGGVFIHHTDVPSTIAKLRELGICAMSLPEPSYG